MSKSIHFLCLAGFLAALAACSAEEIVVVDPEPISVEPTFTGKYK